MNRRSTVQKKRKRAAAAQPVNSDLPLRPTKQTRRATALPESTSKGQESVRSLPSHVVPTVSAQQTRKRQRDNGASDLQQPQRLPSPPSSDLSPDHSIHYSTPLYTSLTREAKRALDQLPRPVSNCQRPSLTQTRKFLAKAVPPSPALLRLSRHGGADLSDISGIANLDANRKMASHNISTTTTKTAAYNLDFENQLIALEISVDAFVEPANKDHLMAILTQGRPDTSGLGKEEYDKFRVAARRSSSESDVVSSVYEMIRGTHQTYQTGDKLFGRTKLFGEGMRKPKPNHFDGVENRSSYSRLLQKLDGWIAPTDGIIFLPNFFGEIKGGEGEHMPAVRQAAYDGAFGARGIQYISKLLMPTRAEFDNNAYTFSATWSSQSLSLFVHWATQQNGPDTSLQYHMYRLFAKNLTSDPKTLQEGITAYRNLRDHAKTIREELVSKACKALDARPDIQVEEYPDVKVPPPPFAPQNQKQSQSQSQSQGKKRSRPSKAGNQPGGRVQKSSSVPRGGGKRQRSARGGRG